MAVNHAKQIETFTKDVETGVNATELLTVNSVNGNVERVMDLQGNNSLKLTYTGDNLTKIEKTIGTTTYTKTLTYDVADHLTDITPWS